MYTPSCVQRYYTQSCFLWLGLGNTGITTLSAVPDAIFLELMSVLYLNWRISISLKLTLLAETSLSLDGNEHIMEAITLFKRALQRLYNIIYLI